MPSIMENNVFDAMKHNDHVMLVIEAYDVAAMVGESRQCFKNHV